MSGGGYGMAQPGIFRMPYQLSRSFMGSGGAQDPLAALIGGVLGTYTAGQEKDKADALAAKQEQDRTNWEDLQRGVEVYKAGLTTQAPKMLSPDDAGRLTTDTSPTPLTPSSAGAQPVVQVGGTSLYRDLQRAPAPGKFTFIHEPGSPIYAGNEGTGAVTPSAYSLPGKLTTDGQKFHIEKDTKGNAYWVPDAPPTGTPTMPGGVARVPGLNLGEPGQHPTPQQGQQAEFGAGALAAWQQVEKERTQNPNVEPEVGKILATPAFVHAIPGFRSWADMATLLQKAGASPAAQRYMRAKWSFLDNVIRTRIPGGRMSGALFQQVGNEFLPSLDTAANAQVRTNELQAILTAQGESGYDANPDIWNHAVKRHGVANIDLQSALVGGPIDSRLTEIRRRYGH